MGAEFQIRFTDDTEFVIGFDSKIETGQTAPYEGPYTVTPSRSTQLLPTVGKRMLESVIIQPIPQNYGLITYNGFEITVS